MAETPTPNTEPVLNLTTMAVGVPIVIDGRTYELRHPYSLSVGRYLRLRELGVVVDTLERKKRTTPEEDTRLADLFREMVSVMLIAPDDVRAALSDLQCTQVIHAFMELRRPRLGAAAEASPLTGSTRSRGSRGSTAARRRTGSGGSRRA